MPATRVGGLDEHRIEEAFQVDRIGTHAVRHQPPALLPRHHQGEHEQADEQREPAAVDHLDDVGEEVGQVDDEEEAGRQHDERPRVAPAVADDEEGHRRRDDHVDGDGDAVGRAERIARAEQHDGDDDAAEEPPVHERHVDLTRLVLRRVQDAQARQVAELDRLLGDRERRRDERLRRDHRRAGGQADERIQRPRRCHLEERVADLRRVGQQHRTLAEIIDDQGRHRHAEPGEADRPLAEVAHVGIERLGAGDAEHDGAERDEADRRLRRQEEEARDAATAPSGSTGCRRCAAGRARR